MCLFYCYLNSYFVQEIQKIIRKESSCLLLISGSSICFSTFYPSHFAERTYTFISAQFGPIGSESQTHVHSEVLLNFPIGREGKRINFFYLTEKLLKLQKIIKISKAESINY